MTQANKSTEFPGRFRKTRRAYLWAYRSNDLDHGPPIVVFDYQTSRSGQHVRNFLCDWHGHLMVDDYGGYKALFRQHLIEQGCWAHARRKFFELHAANQHPTAAQALEHIGRLYALEAQVRTATAAERGQLRTHQAQPELQTLHQWLMELRPRVANRSSLANAMGYTLRRWAWLSLYATTGHLPIDNNAVENAIRPGQEKRVICWQRTRGPTRCCHPKLIGHCKTQPVRTAGLVERHARKITRLAQQSARRTSSDNLLIFYPALALTLAAPINGMAGRLLLTLAQESKAIEKRGAIFILNMTFIKQFGLRLTCRRNKRWN